MSSDAIAIQTAEAAGRPWVEALHEWVTTVDHKRIGFLYILYALVFLLIAGLEATIIRIQLMRPHNDFVSPQVFNRMFTMHGTTMIFFVVIPVVFGFANYLVPLMIGARDALSMGAPCTHATRDSPGCERGRYTESGDRARVRCANEAHISPTDRCWPHRTPAGCFWHLLSIFPQCSCSKCSPGFEAELLLR